MGNRIIYYDANAGDPEAVPGKGFIYPEYALVGIAPNTNRPKDKINEPFGVSSLRILSRIVQAAGDRTLYMTNLIKTPVKSNTEPNKSDVFFYYPRLIQELKDVGVQKRVLALGTSVAKSLCPGFKKMREDHGTLFFNHDLQLWVVPTFHFSATALDPSILPLILRDIERLFNVDDPTPEEYIIPYWDDTEGLPSINGPKIPINSMVAIDIETTGWDKKETDKGLDNPISMIGFKVVGGKALYQIHNPTQIEVYQLFEYFRGRNVTLLGHNFQFDLTRLCKFGKFSWTDPIQDTMLMAHILSEEVLSLKHLTTTYTDRAGSHSFGDTESPDYLSEDVLSTEEVYDHFAKRYTSIPYALDLVHQLVPYMCSMQVRGVYIDRTLLKETTEDYQGRVTRLLDYMDNMYAKINWNSAAQLGPLLIAKGVPLTEKTKTGQLSVSEPILQSFNNQKYPIVQQLLELRDLVKAGQFLHSYSSLTTDEDPYLRPTLKLHGTETGRLSCADPNLQQVTRTGPLKLIFKSRWENGLIGLVDLSQAELRVAAMLSGDEQLALALESEDVHRFIAAKVFNLPPDQVSAAQRKKSKGVTFGLLYGGSPFGLAGKVGVTPAEVQAIIDTFFKGFPQLAKWLEVTGKQGVRDQEVYTITGRRRSLRNLIMQYGEKDARRKAVNTPVQSLASDIMLIILLNLIKYLISHHLKSRPLFTVHDSTMMEIYPGEEDLVAEAVRYAFRQVGTSPIGELELYSKLPIVGELKLGKTWAHCESTSDYYDPCGSYEVSSLG